MTGHAAEATPDNILEAYRHYKDSKISLEGALRQATETLKEWHSKLS